MTRRNKEERRLVVEELTKDREQLSDEQQLKALDNRLGKNQGAAKERNRLKTRIEGAKKATETIEKADAKRAEDGHGKKPPENKPKKSQRKKT